MNPALILILAGILFVVGPWLLETGWALVKWGAGNWIRLLRGEELE